MASASRNSGTHQKIVQDLAEKIEQRGRERFAIKAGNIRKRLIDVMKSAWPNSAEQTLEDLAVKVLRKTPPGEREIFAEIRELNSEIIPSECPLKPYPGD